MLFESLKAFQLSCKRKGAGVTEELELELGRGLGGEGPKPPQMWHDLSAMCRAPSGGWCPRLLLPPTSPVYHRMTPWTGRRVQGQDDSCLVIAGCKWRDKNKATYLGAGSMPLSDDCGMAMWRPHPP